MKLGEIISAERYFNSKVKIDRKNRNITNYLDEELIWAWDKQIKESGVEIL